MPLDPYGGHAPPPGPYVNFNRGFRSTSGYHRPYGFTTRMLQGLLGRGEPPGELGAGTGIPDPRSPEGFGSLLSMALGRRPRFREENVYYDRWADEPGPPPPAPYNVAGVRSERENILAGRLYLWDEANRTALSEPRLAGSLTYMRPHPESNLPAYGGTAYVHPEYRQTGAFQRLAAAFLKEFQGQPIQTHFANPALAKVAQRYMERLGYSMKPGTLGTNFYPPGWVPTRPSPTPLRGGGERPWDIPPPERLQHQREYEEFQEWYRRFRDQLGSP